MPVFWSVFMAIFLASTAAHADGLADAKAGMDALNQNNYAEAVRLFTKALKGRLSPGDKELAYVKRGQAYLGEQNYDFSLADLDKALKLDPDDQEAIGLRLQSIVTINGIDYVKGREPK